MYKYVIIGRGTTIVESIEEMLEQIKGCKVTNYITAPSDVDSSQTYVYIVVKEV